MTRKKLGQNFLVDGSVLDFEADSAGVSGNSVLEIGAGDGRLTAKLLKKGAKSITAVELDPQLASKLRKRFRKNVHVIQGDFLNFDESAKFDRIVGNIPYYITSPILFKVARMEFGSALLCVQKEVAMRMMAPCKTSNYGRLSVSCQLLFKMELLALVARESFFPKPKVDSAIIRIERTGFKLGRRLESVIGSILSHKKKSLRNALLDSREKLFGPDGKEKALEFAKNLKLSQAKVFMLSPSEILEVAEKLV